ncbi:MAG: acylphosphatase [Deltaproteobacteria bacterium]|nr:acylphosphatase [Deltaproteobacteria bacterium]
MSDRARPSSASARLYLSVVGRVQGVGFRYATVDQARRLGLVGWTRNCPDGSVEIVAEGPPTELDRLLVWCRGGPPGALVQHSESRWDAATGEFTDFRIRY